MLTEQSAIQLEKNSLLKDIRHICSTCQCPEHVSIEQLKTILAILNRGKFV